ncbi:uncharacterized protein IL334_000833 [Kwoniella shivajii]|uniref:Uncharacterized protein n=1 Tax=Kwoniella shivajii TaxID=564305 RepID=A0ABZ1CQA3_9TREE|nr:hypothetical protein IL334_000833 [Kwoniella shivajii]
MTSSFNPITQVSTCMVPSSANTTIPATHWEFHDPQNGEESYNTDTQTIGMTQVPKGYEMGCPIYGQQGNMKRLQAAGKAAESWRYTVTDPDAERDLTHIVKVLDLYDIISRKHNGSDIRISYHMDHHELSLLPKDHIPNEFDLTLSVPTASDHSSEPSFDLENSRPIVAYYRAEPKSGKSRLTLKYGSRDSEQSNLPGLNALLKESPFWSSKLEAVKDVMRTAIPACARGIGSETEKISYTADGVQVVIKRPGRGDNEDDAEWEASLTKQVDNDSSSKQH